MLVATRLSTEAIIILLRLEIITPLHRLVIIAAPRRLFRVPALLIRHHRISRQSRPAGYRNLTSSTNAGITTSRQPAVRNGKHPVTMLEAARPEVTEDGDHKADLTIRLMTHRVMAHRVMVIPKTRTVIALMEATVNRADTEIKATGIGRKKITTGKEAKRRRRKRTIAVS